MAESGTEADARRMKAFLQPDGSLLIGRRLAGWASSILLGELARERRLRSEGNASDLLELIDVLMSVEDAPMSFQRQPVMDNGRIESVAAPVQCPGGVESSGDDEALTSAQVADDLGVSIREVQRLAKSGRLTGRRLGRTYIFSREAIDNYKEGA